MSRCTLTRTDTSTPTITTIRTITRTLSPPMTASRESRSSVQAGWVRALAVAFARAGWDVTAVASRDEGRRARFQTLVPGARAYVDAQAVRTTPISSS